MVGKADKLLNDSSFDSRERLASRKKAQALLEEALGLAPDEVEALYYLAWSLATDPAPPADRDARIERLRLRLLDVTNDAQPSKKEPTIEVRARAFALAWALPERAAVARTLAEAEAHVEEAKLAVTLRTSVFTKRATRGAEAGLVFARAREDGDLSRAHQWLWSWIEKNPVHASYLEDRMNGLATASGLEPFFDDDGFVAFVRAQEARSALDTKVGPRAMAFALGFDKCEHGLDQYEPQRFGRLARVLALQKLGAPVETKMKREGSGHWSSIELAAMASPALLPQLVEMGLSLDRGLDGLPPIVSLTEYGAHQGVAALVRAGANKDAKDKKGRTALDIATAKKNVVIAKLLGATRAAGGVDTKPARDFLAKNGADVLDSPWAKRAELTSFAKLEAFLEAVDLHGPARWEDAANLLDTLDAKDRLALAYVLRHAAVAGAPVTSKKIDGETAHIVLGDLYLEGDLVLGSHWLVTGSVRCDRFGDDEGASLTVAGDLDARFIYTEGDLWVGGDVRASAMAWAEYEAGTLCVVGSLTTTLFVEGQHAVEVGKLVADKKIELESTSREDCAAHFPKEAFAEGNLSANKLWKLVRAGTFP